MDSLGEGYGLEDLRAVLSGKKAHTPRKKTVTQAEPPKVKELQTEYAKLLEEKKKTTASGKLVLVKSVRRTRSHRMKFCVQRGLGALSSTSKRRGKLRRNFALCGSVCINTGIACLFLCRNERSQ